MTPEAFEKNKQWAAGYRKNPKNKQRNIKPLSSFDLTDPEQQKAACHWTNLQPLSPIENMKKGAKILTTN